MPYEPISVSNVALLKNVLLSAPLEKDISINLQAIGLRFHANQVSISEKSATFEEMTETYFMFEDSTTVLSINNRCYSVFFNIGEWGYDTRIPGSHICLGTTPLKFGSGYFCQLELSQSFQDDHHIYIVKNISKLAGQGAISRLNHGLGANKVQKHQRRLQLKEKLSYPSISNEQNEWLCLCQIRIDDLKSVDKHSEILCNFMKAFLKYAFTIEEIIACNEEQCLL